MFLQCKTSVLRILLDNQVSVNTTMSAEQSSIIEDNSSRLLSTLLIFVNKTETGSGVVARLVGWDC